MNYSGKSYKDFLKFLHVNYEEIQEYEVCTSDLSVLSFLYESDDHEHFIFAKLDGAKILDDMYNIRRVRVKMNDLKITNPEVIQEIKQEQYVLYDNAEEISLWPTSDLMVTFSQLLKIKGKFLFEAGFARNTVLASEFARSMMIRFIAKKRNNRLFLYGVTGNYYVMEDECLIPDIITACKEQYGRMEACEWKMNDKKIHLFCQFSELPKIKGYEVGVYIQTSYVMASSFQCYFVLKKGSMMIPLQGVVKKHTTKLVGEEIAKELFEMEKYLESVENKFGQIYSKDIKESAKDCKIYNMLGKKRIKEIFPDCQMIQQTKGELINKTKENLDAVDLKDELYTSACRLLGYILVHE